MSGMPNTTGTREPETAAERNRAGDLYEVLARARAGIDQLGLRDRHKVNKLERISGAAHKLFARDGYEGTTLREIAREAGVALGTLSLYARDKRDLILLIFNRVIPPLLEQGDRNAAGATALAGSVAAFFEPFYHEFAADVILYRIVLGQLYGGPASVHASENTNIRASLLLRLRELIGRAVAAGECTADVDFAVQARSFYYLYFAAVRIWLNEARPLPDIGLVELRLLFDQHVAGLQVAGCDAVQAARPALAAASTGGEQKGGAGERVHEAEAEQHGQPEAAEAQK